MRHSFFIKTITLLGTAGLFAACADSSTAPAPNVSAQFAKGAAGGGGNAGGGGGVKTFSTTGEWFGFLTAATPGEASVDLLLTQTGSDITGTITSTLYNQASVVKTSAVTGTSDGVSVTLHFVCPSTDRPCTVATNFIQMRGLGLLAIATDDASGFGVGQFNVVRR
jgi:hypothetical protein